MKSDRLFPAMLRAALLGALLFFVFGALIPPPKPGVALLVGLFGGLSAAIGTFLLAQFPVGPVGKLVLGLICVPFFPVLIVLLTTHNETEAANHLGGAWFASLVLGLFVGILEAYRAQRGARESADVP